MISIHPIIGSSQGIVSYHRIIVIFLSRDIIAVGLLASFPRRFNVLAWYDSLREPLSRVDRPQAKTTSRHSIATACVSRRHLVGFGWRERRLRDQWQGIRISKALFRREEEYEMDLWVVKYASRRSRIKDFLGDSSVRGVD